MSDGDSPEVNPPSCVDIHWHQVMLIKRSNFGSRRCAWGKMWGQVSRLWKF